MSKRAINWRLEQGEVMLVGVHAGKDTTKIDVEWIHDGDEEGYLPWASVAIRNDKDIGLFTKEQCQTIIDLFKRVQDRLPTAQERDLTDEAGA